MADQGGVAFASSEAEVCFLEVEVYSNTALSKGGVGYVENEGKLNVSDSYFYLNVAYKGSVLFILNVETQISTWTSV